LLRFKRFYDFHLGLTSGAVSTIYTSGVALRILATKVQTRLRENASATCHNVRDFMKWLPEYKTRWNPYARRKWHGNPPFHPHPERRWLVHRWTGRLAESIRVRTAISHTSVGRVEVGIDTDIAPYAEFVILGTDKMVPRDFISGTMAEMRGEFPQMSDQSFREAVFLAPPLLSPALYFIARTSKYIGKFLNVAPFVSSMFQLARRARDIEVASFHPAGLSARLFNRTIGGRVASRFLIHRPGYAVATVNAAISKAFTARMFFAPMPRFPKVIRVR